MERPSRSSSKASSASNTAHQRRLESFRQKLCEHLQVSKAPPYMTDAFISRLMERSIEERVSLSQRAPAIALLEKVRADDLANSMKATRKNFSGKTKKLSVQGTSPCSIKDRRIVCDASPTGPEAIKTGNAAYLEGKAVHDLSAAPASALGAAELCPAPISALQMENDAEYITKILQNKLTEWIRSKPKKSGEQHTDELKAEQHIDGLKALVEAFPNLLNQQAPSGETPLTCALHEGAFSLAQALIELGADVNQPNVRGQTPLMLAITKRRELVDLLLEKGSDRLAVNNDGVSTIGLAMLDDRAIDIELIKKLLGSPNQACGELTKAVIETSLTSGSEENAQRIKVLRGLIKDLKDGMHFNPEIERILVVELGFIFRNLDLVNFFLSNPHEYHHKLIISELLSLASCMNSDSPLPPRTIRDIVHIVSFCLEEEINERVRAQDKSKVSTSCINDFIGHFIQISGASAEEFCIQLLRAINLMYNNKHHTIFIQQQTVNLDLVLSTRFLQTIRILMEAVLPASSAEMQTPDLLGIFFE